MASSINSTSAGNGGLVSTGDDSGILNIQTNETTAITVDASQRVAFVAGTAALPAITTAGDTNTGIYFPAADTIAFSEGGAESMRIDSSGNVGIGVTPSSWSGSRALQLSNGVGVSSVNGSNNTQFTNNAYWNGSGWIYIASDYANKYSQVSGTHIWYTASSGTAGNAVTFNESMRIDSSGRLLVGTTSAVSNARCIVSSDPSTGVDPMIVSNTRSGAATDYHIICYRNGSIVGSVQTTLSSTIYATSSDYRLKEDIQPMSGALSKVLQLKPVTYKWKLDGTESQGFIAHELQEVVPEAVCGQKDELDADGNPKYQGIDTSFLVATLTAALQETKALIDTQAETINALTARIVALEAK